MRKEVTSWAYYAELTGPLVLDDERGQHATISKAEAVTEATAEWCNFWIKKNYHDTRPPDNHASSMQTYR